jgi:hypothetical protein
VQRAEGGGQAVTVQALYVDPRGPYYGLLGPENCWDEKRDARTYAGPWPVVAHPPCGPWGSLKHLYRGNEHDCAPRAVEQVRAFGGVLEHPARSKLWDACGLPLPDGLSDGYGHTIEVDQCAWGHVARKRSWLYVVNVGLGEVLAGIRTGGTPTHWVSGFRSSTHGTPKRYRQNGCAVPPGIKVCSAQQRRRTPVAFAQWLIALAQQAEAHRAA